MDELHNVLLGTVRLVERIIAIIAAGASTDWVHCANNLGGHHWVTAATICQSDVSWWPGLTWPY